MRQFAHEGNVPHRPPGAETGSMLEPADTGAAATTILIVEDEIVVSFFMRALFEEKGLQVAIAATAAEALRLVDELGRSLRAAVIDVGLPDSPGDQLVPPIRACLPELPIVIATGFSETEFGRRFEADRRVRVIGKPFDAPQLWSVLGALDGHFPD
jgi:DNA-binding NtrC family response regulator